MPEFDIVDTQVHLWNPQRLRLRWIDDKPVLNRRYELEDYAEHMRDASVEAFVFMETAAEAAYMFHEASWAVGQAEREPRLKGIVAHASVEDGEPVRSQLDALQALGGRIKGVRRVVETEADPRFCLRPEFVQGVQLLEAYGYPFHICMLHHQLPSAIELVRRCPRIDFVLDHIGKPAIKAQRQEPWRTHIRELAALPNIDCKLSGLVTEADMQRWTTDDLRPYVEHVVDCFGEDRVMYGSDFPVLLQASSCRRWVDALEQITRGLPETARRKLWADNAKRRYGL